MAVSAAAKDLLKGVRESVSLIDRLPKDDNGRLRTTTLQTTAWSPSIL
jgi:hypothetical protein